MPGKVTKGGLSGRYGPKLDNAVKNHANDDTDYGIIQLPGGIKNGIAQLDMCKFDTYKTGDNEGEYYFFAQGVVISPFEVKTDSGKMKVQGLHTRLGPIPVCDTKKRNGDVVSLDDHVKEILNHMRLLGGEEFTNGATGRSLEGLASALEKAQPYFRFSTRESKATEEYEARTWESWYGTKGLENFDPDSIEPQDEDEDETPESADVDDLAEDDAGFDEFADLDSLAEKAQKGDQEAQDTLTEMAREAGFTVKEIKAKKKWSEVADLCRPSEEEVSDEEVDEDADEEVSDEGEDESEEEEFTPAKSEIYNYSPIDPKTKKPVKKPLTVEVIKVNEKKRTVSLRGLINKKIYQEVSWDDLEPMEDDEE